VAPQAVTRGSLLHLPVRGDGDTTPWPLTLAAVRLTIGFAATRNPRNISAVPGYHNLISGSFTVNDGGVDGDLNMNFSYHNAQMAWLQLDYGDGSQPYVWATVH